MKQELAVGSAARVEGSSHRTKSTACPAWCPCKLTANWLPAGVGSERKRKSREYRLVFTLRGCVVWTDASWVTRWRALLGDVTGLVTLNRRDFMSGLRKMCASAQYTSS